ncbi:MAG: 30S ribosomal protein S2 [Alphaproteobacteria bacterium]|nr:30S ribosomal protein S2 [Alphaproteobacteria bacterium]
MAVPTFTMRQLLEAGVHFGHHTRRWNPKMGPHLFGIRNGVHIIDLQQTVPLLYQALNHVRDVAAANGRVLFVGTKRAATDIIAEAAARCGQYYVNHRWLGGMLTNWKTISNSIRTLRQLEEQLSSEEAAGLTKKELLKLTRRRDKLERALGGIKEMGGRPDILVVIDTKREALAVAEATKLGIPVVGIVDSNADPDPIDFVVPGNDDAMRAIQLYCDLFAGAVLDGLQEELAARGVDTGEADAPPTPDTGPDTKAADKGKEKAKGKEKVKEEVKEEAKAETETAAETTADAKDDGATDAVAAEAPPDKPASDEQGEEPAGEAVEAAEQAAS